ncbi:hypothetical protein G1H11_05670 [Phytoactinopolyspora alkaliphila]|uniref:Uncharacterized protein n=1 Tax=Phytoactinopolyspora alkaliphila TaxID=1783498 RepID=A0A6N9YIN1_9ACTN|nr:hypothetical protein [Phytoactinopolyspora alkaliphila]NED94795.1 hypothetical protein [Phytoactinopolyspora alkaliphila]
MVNDSSSRSSAAISTTHTTLPAPSDNNRRQRTRILSLMLAALTVLAVSACGAISESLRRGDNGDVKTFEFTRGADGKADDVIPDWVPDDATHVRYVMRTTGDERLLVMRATADALPDSCEEVSADELRPRPVRAGEEPDDYRTDATLTAQWWDEGREHKSTITCGPWWISPVGDSLFAFRPELKSVQIEEPQATQEAP